jgi:uncharacterized protein (DUF433 family)
MAPTAYPHVCVHRLFAWLEGGTTVEVLLKRYPNVSKGQLFCALGFAYDHLGLMQHWIQEERAALARHGAQTA